MGIGNMAIACVRLDMGFIGFEIDEEEGNTRLVGMEGSF